MLVNLSDVLSEQHKTIDKYVPIKLKEFTAAFGTYPILRNSSQNHDSKDDMHLVIEHVQEKKLEITGAVKLSLEVPCDRCLKSVVVELDLEFSREVDLADQDKTDEVDEANYIDGYHLDVDRLLYNEILTGWPAKILCNQDCKGICHTCGRPLHEEDCSCEATDIDPRMSAIRDVFKNFKEV